MHIKKVDPKCRKKWGPPSVSSSEESDDDPSLPAPSECLVEPKDKEAATLGPLSFKSHISQVDKIRMCRMGLMDEKAINNTTYDDEYLSPEQDSLPFHWF